MVIQPNIPVFIKKSNAFIKSTPKTTVWLKTKKLAVNEGRLIVF